MIATANRSDPETVAADVRLAPFHGEADRDFDLAASGHRDPQ
jgi:hypothetical protein